MTLPQMSLDLAGKPAAREVLDCIFPGGILAAASL